MLLDLLEKRRSIRQFEERQVEKEKLEAILEAALRSPASRTSNPWEFIVVDEPETIAALSLAKAHGSAFMKNAPLAIVVCADPKRSDVWIEDASIATLLIHLAAADQGLGSCWVQMHLRQNSEGVASGQYVKDILKIADDREVEAIVAIGYGKEEKPGHAREKLLWDRLSHNQYGRKF